VKDSNRDVSCATAAEASDDARAAVASIGRATKRRGRRRAREGALSRTSPTPRTPRDARPDAEGARPPGEEFATGEADDASVREACVLAGARLGSIPQVRPCARREVSRCAMEVGFGRRAFHCSLERSKRTSRTTDTFTLRFWVRARPTRMRET
jgi:hypothetical protein